MRKIDYSERWHVPKKRKTEFTTDELWDIIDFYIQYKPIFDENSDIEIDYPPTRAAHDFSILLYKFETIDLDYHINFDSIRKKYGKRHVNDLSKEKLDFFDIMTIFTFIHRAERFSGGWYEGCIKDKTYYNLLSRLEEIRKEISY